MPLRPVSELGLVDATDVTPVIRDEREPTPSAEESGRSRSPRGPRRRPSSNGAAATPAAVGLPSAAPAAQPQHVPLAEDSAEPNGFAVAGDSITVEEARERHELPLADQPPTFLQIMLPGELHERLADVSHALAADHRKLRHHKAILGALIWRYVLPDDPNRYGNSARRWTLVSRPTLPKLRLKSRPAHICPSH